MPAGGGCHEIVKKGRRKDKEKDKRNREQGTRKKEQGRSKISHPGLKLELNLPGFEMTMYKYRLVISNSCIEAWA